MSTHATATTKPNLRWEKEINLKMYTDNRPVVILFSCLQHVVERVLKFLLLLIVMFVFTILNERKMLQKTGKLLLIVCISLVTSSETSLAWSLFRPSLLFSNSSSSHLQEYARQKLSTLRHLRNKLNDNDKVQFIQHPVGDQEILNATTPTKANPILDASLSSIKSTPATLEVAKREEAAGGIFKSVDNLLSFTTGPLRKMITSKQGIESLASMVMPKRDVLRKLLEIKGHLEPSFKRYLTDKYNGFLSSLIPYSENIGVPPFVLNSMKVPQDFDPRWQLIETMLESQGGVENFLHTMIKGDFSFGKMADKVQSRTTGDETELISDQEPDASGQGYRKPPQLYLSAFKKRVMKPAGGKVRLSQQTVRSPSALDYDSLLDQAGQFGHVTYDMRIPDELMSESYYNGDLGAAEFDMSAAASGHGGGRGHGHGHGHGQSSYGGFLDPFTILGGLAFLTYLGLMLQNSLNRGGNGTTMGKRSYSEMENLLPVVPISLKSSLLNLQRAQSTVQHSRHGRSMTAQNEKPIKPVSVTVDNVLKDISELWEELRILDNEISTFGEDWNCVRFRKCMFAWKMRIMNLEPVFAGRFIATTHDLSFLNYVLRGKLQNMCEPYRSENCKL